MTSIFSFSNYVSLDFKFTLAALIGFFLLINVLTFMAFGADKKLATTQQWRVPEKYLLLLAAAGGSIGAKLAQRRFHHKTTKQPFGWLLNGIVIAQICLLLLLTEPVQSTLADVRDHLRNQISEQLSSATEAPAHADGQLPTMFGPGS